MSGYIGTTPVPQATQHREAFTANADQTTFATAGYTVGFIDVWLNGVKLAAADVTVTNGSDIVLASAAAANDIIEYVAFVPFNAANQTFTGATVINSLNINSDGATVTGIKDEDNMASNDANKLATQQSIKAYVDSTVAATNEVVEDTTPQLGGDLASNGNDILMADNDKVILGTGSDLQLYHDGSNSYISNSTGWLNMPMSGNGISIANSDFSESIAKFVKDGAVELYHNGSKKFETNSGGATVTGTLLVDGFSMGDNETAYFGTDNDLRILHTGSHGQINNTVGNLTLDVAGDITLDADGGDINLKDNGTQFASLTNSSSNLHIVSEVSDKDILFKGNDGGSFITALTLDMSSGGTAYFADDVRLTDNHAVRLGTDGDIVFYHDNSNGYLENGTGNLTLDVVGIINLDADNGGNINLKDGGTHYGTIQNENSDLRINSIIQDKDIIFRGNDGGTGVNALTLDMSNAGAATFNSTVTIPTIAYVGTSIVHDGDANTSIDFNTDSQTFYAGGVRALDLNTGGVYVNSAAVDMDFRVSSDNNADMFFVDGGNNAVVVGQSAPDTTISGGTPAFQVIGTGVAASASITRREANQYGPTLFLTKSRNTAVGSNTIVNNGDALGVIAFIGDDGTNLDTYGATITASVDATPGANDMPTRLSFSVTADGASSPTERMRIDSSGRVGIGATVPDARLEVRTSTSKSNIKASGGHNSNCKVEIGYDNDLISGTSTPKGAYIAAGSSGNSRLQVFVDNTTLAAEFRGNTDFYSNDGTVHSLSDSRVKKNIADLTDGLAIVKQLKPRTFKFNGKATTLDDNRTKYGFIADEVITVAPQYVSVDTQTIDDVEVDDFKSLSTTKMIPMLVKAIQEQQEVIESLTARITALEA